MSASTVRRELELNVALPTIVMTGGSLGYGPYEEVVQHLEAAKREVQFLALTGRNTRLCRRLQALAPKLNHVRLCVYGYVDGMHRFMDAADAVISKTNAATTAATVRYRCSAFLRRYPLLSRFASMGSPAR